jgi:catechol 2,3-dioxygenase-like lactoylglutathione lyase family enzyme
MIDHIGIPVSDLDRSVAFYTHALAPLGYTLIRQFPGVAGFGADGKPDFWISQRPVGAAIHVAFRTPSRKVVQAFHEAGLAAGGRDNGPPGVRAMYHPHYYGAFLFDPDGHNVEAVCHEPYLS